MTQTTEIFDRLRSAKPDPSPAANRADVWKRIVSAPGDPRLSPNPQSRTARGWRKLSRRPGTMLACALVVAGCGTGVTVLTDSLLSETPAKLFAFAPKPGNPLWGPHRHLQIIPASIRMVERIKVPDVGTIQYWVARTRLGGDCEAFRLPDGGWAGTGESHTYSFGGITPTCTGFLYTPMGRHFAFDSVTFGRVPHSHTAALPGPRQWTVVFGTVKRLAQATTVREIASGASTRILRDGYFALVIPEHLVLARTTPGGCSCGRDTKIWFPGAIRLEALAAVATSKTGQGG